MQHQRKGRKFGRKKDQRRALLKSLASSFFMLGRIKTTEAKAKELRPLAERFITRAKKPTLANRRILARFFSNEVVKRVIEHAATVGDRRGGYTRIIKLGRRKSDASPMAFIELVK